MTASFHHPFRAGSTPPIRFVTDGRIYQSPSDKGREFVVVEGTLETGPPGVGALVIEFYADLCRPDGADLEWVVAHLDYPVHPEESGEELGVILYDVKPADVPIGTVIRSREADFKG